MATLRVQQTPENAIFPVDAADLPRPPAYVPDPQDQQESHCREWAPWLREQRAAMLSLPAIAVSAPADAAATVTAIRPRIHRAEQPRDITYVQCHEGGGGYDPTYVELDLDSPDQPPKLLADGGSREIGTIPDAVFVAPKGRTEVLAFRPLGRTGVFYEWGVEVDVVVDGTKRTLTFGSKRRPFRSWLGDAPYEQAVDYDPRIKRWVPVGQGAGT